MGDRVEKLYQKCICKSCGGIRKEQITADFGGIDLTEIALKAAKRFYDKASKGKEAGLIDSELYVTEANELISAFTKEYEAEGEKVITFGYSKNGAEWVRNVRHNLQSFVAFKHHSHVNSMVDLLVDDNGDIREWSDFRAEVKKLNIQYFDNWLKSEYNHAVTSGQMAAKWHGYARNPELKYLQYTTQRDSRVRESHKNLDGATYEIDSDFWDKFYPPNGWLCRCTTKQVAGPGQQERATPTKNEVPDEFRINTGKTGIVYNRSHPYFDTMKPEVADKVMDAARQAQLSTNDFFKNALSAAAKTKSTVLTDCEKAALRTYTTAVSQDLNRRLRNNSVSLFQQTLADGATVALDKLQNYEGISFRTVNSTSKIIDFENLKVGDEFADKAFLSSSKSKEWIDIQPQKKFNYTFSIEGKTGKGIKDFSRHPEQDEVLFKPETPFIVKEKIITGNNISFILTEK